MERDTFETTVRLTYAPCGRGTWHRRSECYEVIVKAVSHSDALDKAVASFANEVGKDKVNTIYVAKIMSRSYVRRCPMLNQIIQKYRM